MFSLRSINIYLNMKCIKETNKNTNEHTMSYYEFALTK